MDDLIKYCNERDLDKVIKYFYLNKYPDNSFEEGSNILESVIINQDIEILEVLLKNKIVFNEDVLNSLPYSNEDIFLLVYNYIKNNGGRLNINLNNKQDFLLDLCKSYSSTEKMFFISLNSGFFDINYKDYSGKKLIHLIVYFGKKGFIKYLKEYNIDYLEKDEDGYTVLDYAIRKNNSSIIYDLITLKPILQGLFANQYCGFASSILYK